MPPERRRRADRRASVAATILDARVVEVRQAGVHLPGGPEVALELRDALGVWERQRVDASVATLDASEAQAGHVKVDLALDAVDMLRPPVVELLEPAPGRISGPEAVPCCGIARGEPRPQGDDESLRAAP